jgi:hypothetical protein
LNIEKSTREKLNQMRRDDRSYDDAINRILDDYRKLEEYLPFPYDSIPKFLRHLSRTDDVGYKLYKFIMDG